MIFSGVFNNLSNGYKPNLAMSIITNVKAIPMTIEPATERFNKSSSFAPKLRATTILKPFPTPIAKPINNS